MICNDFPKYSNAVRIYIQICKYPTEKYLNTSIERNNIIPTQKAVLFLNQVYFVS